MDADWISPIVSFYEQAKPVLIVMPVLLKAKTFFEEMQALEILSLTATTASSLAAEFPLMCNGANLAFEKKCFDDAYSSNRNIPTGDDTFLMFQLHDKFKNRVVYLKSKNVIVRTNPEKTFATFLHQRIRWTSKVKHYSKPYVTLIGALIFVVALFQVSFLFLIPSIHSIHELFFTAILLFVPKAIIDFSYLLILMGEGGITLRNVFLSINKNKKTLQHAPLLI